MGDLDYKDYLVKSIHKNKNSIISNFPINFDLNEVHSMDKMRDKINDTSK